MADPISRQPYWYIKDPKTGLMVKSTSQPAANPGMPITGWGSSAAPPPDGHIETFADGQKWDVPADGSDPTNLNTPSELQRIQSGQTPDQFTLGKSSQRWEIGPDGQPRLIASGQGITTRDTKNPYLPGQDETGYREPNPDFLPPDVSTNTTEQFIVRRGRNGELIQELNPNYVPPKAPQAPQRAPRYPEEEQLAQLQVQKARRDLENPYLLQQQQLGEVIANIKAQLARGEVSFAQADKLMGLARSNTEAALRGTTPFQMQQQQQGLARGVLGDQAQTASGLATGLLGGLTGIYNKVYSSANPPAIDPFDLVGPFMQQYGGGPQMGELAKAILMGALQPQGGF